MSHLSCLPALVVALTLFTWNASPVNAENEQHATAFETCAKACDDCKRACDMCAAHCAKLLSDGKKEHLVTLKTCSDCASICAAASCVVSGSGPFSDLICKACEKACKRCGDECAKFKNDPMMTKCAEECRKCEKACQEMLKHVEAK